MWKTLLFHDTFLMKWGAERMNIEIAKTLDADIATAVWSPNCYDAQAMEFKWKIIEVDPNFKRGMLGFILMKWRFFCSKKLVSDYGKIFFSNEAITGIWNVWPNTKTYYYAHSISRHLFDQREQYLQKVPFLIRPGFLLFSVFLRWLYTKEIQKVDTIFVNSEANKKRMSEWLGRDDAIVIYPSVDTDKFRIFPENEVLQILATEWILLQNKWYYISFSRLTHAKRIDVIIRTFQKIPDKKVLILYGENDSQKDEFIKMGEGYPNIIFHSLKNNENLPIILSGALASICVSENEDFGMVAIESMASGVPVIAVDEWGYRESIIHDQTGFLIHPDNLKENLVSIIENTWKNVLQEMQGACVLRAENFSLKKMYTKIQEFIQ